MALQLFRTAGALGRPSLLGAAAAAWCSARHIVVHTVKPEEVGGMSEDEGAAGPSAAEPVDTRYRRVRWRGWGLIRRKWVLQATLRGACLLEQPLLTPHPVACCAVQVAH